ncbi:hypothetical protein N0V93_004978 [Gnomoniopsis smithogilvyi]|uniref:TM7S3/TM198-like domain-containing protein n=1 Tax=Gnomoniopsis smithogilvyi TaxID=1191159 RepID=A0A9W8YS17_9PEZI|nr:hypothetical protein N0V93_004978 [Gnomoniopsis smithogilvyi]
MRVTAMAQRTWAILALLLCLNVVLAGVMRPLPRQEDSTSIEPTSTSSTPAASTEASDDASTSASASITSSIGTETATASTTTGSSTGSATSAIISATPIAPSNSTQFNTTEPGQLPLTPTRTPGFYVAGFILMISGALYIIFGMKRQWIHCSFSFAYLVAIAIAALELLLVPSPISDGVQAGYIVAAIVGGAVAGGLATLRPKFFYFFGSFLGGFCFAMWLLTLKESALFGRNVGKNCIFLAAFSCVGLGFYVSTKTRHYLIMFSSSFAGATAFILGVDCLTCAGLKEFWAWIGNFPNVDLFPIDANTYPLTTGMKAELGLLVVIFLLGVVFQWSQLKTIKQERIRKEAERDAGRAVVHKADEKAGMEFERRIANERRHFERTYRGSRGVIYEGRGSRTDKFLSPIRKLWMSIDGKHAKTETEHGVPREVDADNDVESVGSGQASEWASVRDGPKHQARESVHTACDSGVGDADNERKHRASGSATTVTRVSTGAGKQEIEMENIRPMASSQAKTAADAMMIKDEVGGRVTVHVAADEKHTAAGAWAAQNPVPEVVPLPFKVPSMEDDEDVQEDEGDCSSVAVMTEGFLNDEALETRSIGSKRSSFAKRLSTGSAELFRRLSHHSLSNHLDKVAIGRGESTEDLAAGQHDNRSSIAATRDDVSSVNEDDLPASRGLTGERPYSVEIKAELANNPTMETAQNTHSVNESDVKKTAEQKPASTANAALDARVSGAEHGSAREDHDILDSTKEEKGKQVTAAASEDEQSVKPAKTNTSDAPSGPLNLATGKLEKRVSEIVKKYRINEWTKHQTLAEEPILDNPDLAELEDPSKPVPVNVEELVKTAETAVPKLAKPRTEALLQARARKASAQPQLRPSLNSENDRNGSMGSEERQAAIQAAADALVGGTGHRASPTSPAADAVRSRPPIPGVKSFNTPQSLVAKRETMLRMKQHALRPDTLRTSSNPASGQIYPLAPNHGEGYGNVAALGPPSLASAPNSTPSSRRNSGTYRHTNMSSPLQMEPENDDMPLSQRQAIIRARRSSMESGNSSGNHTGSNGSTRRSFSGYSPGEYGSASSLAVNQNIPHTQRRSFTTGSQARESQLAGFRSAVQADLRASNTGFPVTNMYQQPGFGGSYISNNGMAPVQGPLINSVYSIPGTSSANSLLPQQTQPWNAEVSMSLEVQRQYMMAQKENDARRRESRKAEREKQSQLRQSSMGTARFMDAHSAALINLQKKARDAL